MTEEDIDRLFNRSKSKTKTETHPHDDWKKQKPIRDFANSVKFLKVDDSTDRLLNGLPTMNELDENKIDQLFGEHEDLTAEFKKDYTVGRIVG